MVSSTLKVLISTPHFRGLFLCISLLASILANSSAQAQSCGEEHAVVSGESLSKIAQRVYGDTQKWTLIYNVNLSVIGSNPNLIFVGQQLRIPCLVEKAALTPAPTIDDDESADPGSADPDSADPDSADPDSDSEAVDAQTSDDEKSDDANGDSANPVSTATENTKPSISTNDTTGAIRFLTADDYAPFTDRALINDGLVTDMLATSLRLNPSKPVFEVNWINDWSKHLDPLLSSHEYDMGFPWLRPDCESTPDEYRCKNFVFSNPIFQMLVLLFVDKDRPLVFNSDADIEGAVLCRPKGYYTHDLEKDGRLWLSNNVIELKQPDSIKECFEMLTSGAVDAVALNEFTGRSAVSSLSLKDRIIVLEGRPLSIEGLHVVVHKEHPRASELIDTINDSMTELQLSDTHSSIVDTHFRRFWSTIE